MKNLFSPPNPKSLPFLLLTLVIYALWPFPSAPLAEARPDRSGLYQLSKAQLLSRVTGHVAHQYVARERIHIPKMARAALLEMERQVKELRIEEAKPRAPARTPSAIFRVFAGETQGLFDFSHCQDLFALNWKMAELFAFLEKSLPQESPLKEVEYAAITGMLSTLDPHSNFLSPETYRDLQLFQHGRFGGLGLSVGQVDGRFVIQDLIKKGPGEEAGLKVGDEIIQVEHFDSRQLDLDELVTVLRGDINTEVSLSVKREGETLGPLRIKRQDILLQSVSFELFDKDLAWIHIKSFQESTGLELQDAIQKLKLRTHPKRALVLDLRDNPGGLLEQAILVADSFLSSGTIVTTLKNGGLERDASFATRRQSLTQNPMIVLVNRQTASAAEIVAGALKQNQRALILGQRSFGKGSVQVVYRLDDAALKLTVAEYITPNDVSIQGVGIVPDIDLVPLEVPSFPLQKGERFVLHPTPENEGGEQALPAVLSSALTRDEEPTYTLRILKDSKTPSHLQSAERRVMDDAIRLARQLFQAAPFQHSEQALKVLSPFLEQYQKLEDQRLQTALSEHGIDWSKTDKEGSLKALQMKFINDKGEALGPSALKLKAGDNLSLSLEITNRGQERLSQVHVEFHANLGSLDEEELIFGAIAGKSSLRKRLGLPLPSKLPRSLLQIEARLYVNGQESPIKSQLKLEVEPLPEPQFSFSSYIDDSEKGNADGVLQEGEAASLVFRFQNEAELPLDGLRVQVHEVHHHGLQLKQLHAPLKKLEGSKTWEARFPLRVKAQSSVKTLFLAYEIRDQKSRLELKPPILQLPLLPDEGRMKRLENQLALFPNRPVWLRSGAHRDSGLLAEVMPEAALEVSASMEGWVEVLLPDRDLREKAWVERGQVKLEVLKPQNADALSANPILQSKSLRPPRLYFAPIQRFQSEKVLKINGHLSLYNDAFESPVFYVLHNGKKVLLQILPEGKAEQHLSFSIPIKLEKGENQIDFMAFPSLGQELIERWQIELP